MAYANSRVALDAVYAACATWIFEVIDGGGDPVEAMGHVRLMREIEQTIAERDKPVPPRAGLDVRTWDMAIALAAVIAEDRYGASSIARAIRAEKLGSGK